MSIVYPIHAAATLLWQIRAAHVTQDIGTAANDANRCVKLCERFKIT